MFFLTLNAFHIYTVYCYSLPCNAFCLTISLVKHWGAGNLLHFNTDKFAPHDAFLRSSGLHTAGVRSIQSHAALPAFGHEIPARSLLRLWSKFHIFYQRWKKLPELNIAIFAKNALLFTIIIAFELITALGQIITNIFSFS